MSRGGRVENGVGGSFCPGAMVIMRAFFTMSLAVGAAHAQYAAGIRTDATQRIRPFILLGIP